MEFSYKVVFFLLGMLVGITSYSIYVSFGVDSEKLRDPFEEHES